MHLCNCGNQAFHMCQMTTHECEPFPICTYCMQENDWKAQEVNDHEMKHFGGAYGLVTYHYYPITQQHVHPCKEVIPIEYYMEK